jgi:hypothetical protein
MLRRPPYRFLPHAADWACRTSAQEPTFCRRPGHKNIQHTVRYTDMAPDRFKDFWRD